MTPEEKFIIDSIRDQYDRLQTTLTAVQLERMQQTEEIGPMKSSLERLITMTESNFEKIEAHIEKTENEIQENKQAMNARLTEIEDLIKNASTLWRWTTRIAVSLAAIAMFLLTFSSKFSEWYDKLKTK